MTIEDQIKDEKLQHDINREAAKISTLSSGKVDKYEYLTGEEMLPTNQREIIKQAKFTYSPLGKAFGKQTKTIEDQGKKQAVALDSLKTSDKELPLIKNFIPIGNLNPEITDEIKRIEQHEKHVHRDKMVYKATNKTYFRNSKTIRAYGNEIRNNVIDIDTEKAEQANLTMYIKDFANKTKPRNLIQKKLKGDVLASALSLYRGREIVYKAFQSGIFPKPGESQEGNGFKILTPNEMLKKIPIALPQVKAGNNSEYLLNEIRQIIYSLYRSKEITKKVYNKIIKSIKVKTYFRLGFLNDNTKIDTISMNSENSKTSEYHV